MQLRIIGPILIAKRQRFRAKRGETCYGDDKAPSAGWLGVWHEPVRVVGGPPSDEPEPYIGVVPAELNAMLHDLGFNEPEMIYRGWKQKGWILCSDESGKTRTRYGTRMLGKKVWLIAIRMHAIENAGDETTESRPNCPTSNSG